MIALIVVFAGLICVAGIAIIVNPAAVTRLLAGSAGRLELQVLAVVIRLALGIALVLSADASRFPAAVHVLGWISIVAALGLAAIGRQRFIALMRWSMQWVPRFGRIAGVVATALGAFLIYAFV